MAAVVRPSRFLLGGRPSLPSGTVGRRLAKSSEGQDGSSTFSGVLIDAVNRDQQLSVFMVPIHTLAHVAYALAAVPVATE